MAGDYCMLQHGGWLAVAAPELGGNIIRLEYEGKPILRPMQSLSQLRDTPYVVGSPLLLPANRTYAGQFTFEGVSYQLPVNEPEHNAHLHGFVHEQVFAVERYTASSVALRFENRGEIYPFPFRLFVEYTLSGAGLASCYRIQNTGGQTMPVTFALHTTFEEPDSFSIPLAQLQERDAHLIPTGRYLPLPPQARRYTAGAPSKGNVVSGYYRSGGGTARIGPCVFYRVSAEFDHWVLFNAGGQGGYLCVEPQCGAVNGLNIENGHRTVVPGGVLTLSTEIAYRRP